MENFTIKSFMSAPDQKGGAMHRLFQAQSNLLAKRAIASDLLGSRPLSLG